MLPGWPFGAVTPFGPWPVSFGGLPFGRTGADAEALTGPAMGAAPAGVAGAVRLAATSAAAASRETRRLTA
jgi:hypothetical protein